MVQGYKEKLLSKPRKEILIKGVAQALPTYARSIFRLPDSLLEEVHNVLAKFWWGTSDQKRKIHWRNWEFLCLPKSMGGMGFRDLKTFNEALPAKQAWRLATNDKSLLHCILKAKYFPRSSSLRCFEVTILATYGEAFGERSVYNLRGSNGGLKMENPLECGLTIGLIMMALLHGLRLILSLILISKYTN